MLPSWISSGVFLGGAVPCRWQVHPQSWHPAQEEICDGVWSKVHGSHSSASTLLITYISTETSWSSIIQRFLRLEKADRAEVEEHTATLLPTPPGKQKDWLGSSQCEMAGRSCGWLHCNLLWKYFGHLSFLLGRGGRTVWTFKPSVSGSVPIYCCV